MSGKVNYQFKEGKNFRKEVASIEGDIFITWVIGDGLYNSYKSYPVETIVRLCEDAYSKKNKVEKASESVSQEYKTSDKEEDVVVENGDNKIKYDELETEPIKSLSIEEDVKEEDIEENKQEEVDFYTLSRDKLVDMANTFGLDSTGKKKDLIERILKHTNNASKQ